MHAEEAQGGAGRGVIFLRLYERSERRVVGEWEVVPVYEKQGVFVCMRKKLKAVQGVA